MEPSPVARLIQWSKSDSIAQRIFAANWQRRSMAQRPCTAHGSQTVSHKVCVASAFKIIIDFDLDSLKFNLTFFSRFSICKLSLLKYSNKLTTRSNCRRNCDSVIMSFLRILLNFLDNPKQNIYIYYNTPKPLFRQKS